MTRRWRTHVSALVYRLRQLGDRLGAAAVHRGLPPAWCGYRWVAHETVGQYFARHGGNRGAHGRLEVIHPESVASHPLPCNVPSRDLLPADRGWWGYSFRDVPARTSSQTAIVTLPDCRIVWYRDPAQADDFYPAILTGGDRALDLREIRFRPRHAEWLRQRPPVVHLDKATWCIERVYHNHSHWLTAHLPKLLLLKERGALDDVLLPPERTAAIDGSLRLLGLEPESFPTFDMSRPLHVGELTLLVTDRFRPELLQLVPRAYGVLSAPPPRRRIFISRAQAARRRLVNEPAVWALLQPLGFERVVMEALSFDEQMRMLRDTAVLVAPHGAGLTNMLFCPPGAHIVEIADLGFPNPNFYAVASAMGHHYWIVEAASLGDVPRLEQDLRADEAELERVLKAIMARLGAGRDAGEP
jgi:hypothetical protein